MRSFWDDHRGVAGIEFALVAGVLCILLLNGIEVARYAYTVMQVQNAAQIGAQAAWKACDPTKELPATTQCASLTDAIALAITSTTLGDGVKLQDNSPMEAYYCLNNANALIPDAGIPLANKPTNCNTIAGAQAGQPGDYIRSMSPTTTSPCFSTLRSEDCLARPSASQPSCDCYDNGTVANYDSARGSSVARPQLSLR